jgi:hypothetical protein
MAWISSLVRKSVLQDGSMREVANLDASHSLCEDYLSTLYFCSSVIEILC